MLTIVDDLVSVDNLIEDYLTAEPINEYVQSCDIVAFNKICKFIFHVVVWGSIFFFSKIELSVFCLAPGTRKILGKKKKY